MLVSTVQVEPLSLQTSIVVTVHEDKMNKAEIRRNKAGLILALALLFWLILIVAPYVIFYICAQIFVSTFNF